MIRIPYETFKYLVRVSFGGRIRLTSKTTIPMVSVQKWLWQDFRVCWHWLSLLDISIALEHWWLEDCPLSFWKKTLPGRKLCLLSLRWEKIEQGSHQENERCCVEVDAANPELRLTAMGSWAPLKVTHIWWAQPWKCSTSSGNPCFHFTNPLP